jgi:hypothetical protein
VVSWVPQIVVPPLVALAFFRQLPRRWVLWLAPTTYLADLDYLVPGEHRVYTHTLLIPAALLGAVAFLWRRQAGRVPEPLRFWAFARQPGWPLALLLASYYLAAHAVMDVFTGGVALFWPLWPTNYFIDYSITIDLVSGKVTPQAETGALPQPNPLDESYPWLSGEHTAILAFLLCVGLVALAVWLRRRARPHAPSTNDKTAPPVERP